MRQVSISILSVFFFSFAILGVELSTLHMLSQNSAAEMSQAACLMGHAIYPTNGDWEPDWQQKSERDGASDKTSHVFAYIRLHFFEEIMFLHKYIRGLQNVMMAREKIVST